MDVIPAVDVLDGKVVRLVEGDFRRVTEYADDPAEQAAAWIESGATLVHLVDLSGARTGAPSPGLIFRVAARSVRFQVGGGIRSVEAATAAISAGAGRVVVGTVAVEDPALLDAIITAIGPDRVVVALDVRSGRSLGSGWSGTGRPWKEVVADVVAAGASHVLVTGIERDGTFAGPDLELARSVRDEAPDLTVIASGGVGSVADIVAARRAGMDGVIVGKALYDGRLTFEAALAASAAG